MVWSGALLQPAVLLINNSVVCVLLGLVALDA